MQCSDRDIIKRQIWLQGIMILNKMARQINVSLFSYTDVFVACDQLTGYLNSCLKDHGPSDPLY